MFEILHQSITCRECLHLLKTCFITCQTGYVKLWDQNVSQGWLILYASDLEPNWG